MKTRDIIMIVLASVFGFAGGALYSRIQLARASHAQVVRATRFELVDGAGKEIATWGTDDPWKRAVLSFKGEDNHPVAMFGVEGGKAPFFDLAGKDGKSRVRVEVDSWEKPYLAMSDETWEGRVLLGFIPSDAPDLEKRSEWDEWGLLFRGPDGRVLASMGMGKDHGKLSGSATVSRTGKGWSVP